MAWSGQIVAGFEKNKDAETAIRKAIERSPAETISTRYYLGHVMQGRNMKAAAANECSAISKLEPRDKWETKKQQKVQQYLKQCAMSWSLNCKRGLILGPYQVRKVESEIEQVKNVTHRTKHLILWQ